MKPEDQKFFLKLADVDLLALTMFFEARGETLDGIVAVANVIKNRTIQRKKTYHEIILTPRIFGYEQFSFLNSEPNLDPQYYRAVHFAQEITGGKTPEELTGIFNECRWLAQGVVIGAILDNVKGANHYFNPRVRIPGWSKGMSITRIIGNHTFLRG